MFRLFTHKQYIAFPLIRQACLIVYVFSDSFPRACLFSAFLYNRMNRFCWRVPFCRTNFYCADFFAVRTFYRADFLPCGFFAVQIFCRADFLPCRFFAVRIFCSADFLLCRSLRNKHFYRTILFTVQTLFESIDAVNKVPGEVMQTNLRIVRIYGVYGSMDCTDLWTVWI